MAGIVAASRFLSAIRTAALTSRFRSGIAIITAGITRTTIITADIIPGIIMGMAIARTGIIIRRRVTGIAITTGTIPIMGTGMAGATTASTGGIIAGTESGSAIDDQGSAHAGPYLFAGAPGTGPRSSSGTVEPSSSSAAGMA
jgi:hypothetical protein